MKIVPIRFEDEMWEALKKEAEEMGLPISTLIKVILKKELKERAKKQDSKEGE